MDDACHVADGPSSPIVGSDYVRFDDLVTDTALVFSRPSKIIAATTSDQVRSALRAVEDVSRDGRWAAGFVSYEAASGLDPNLATLRSSRTSPEPMAHAPPLVWFAVFDQPRRTRALADLPALTYSCEGLTLSTDFSSYRSKVAAVQAHIAAGDTYQCNYTERLTGQLNGPPSGLYSELARGQRAAYNAFISAPGFAVASASPELFFSWTGDTIRCRPMKGTSRRGLDHADDASRRAALLSNDKDIAENVMIVDLIRNDLSTIATPGSVTVNGLLECEKYPTVWQLTSTVEATVPGATTLTDIFAGLFPCGSVTGAPKRSTMEIISAMEDRPRGVYCGAIGWVAPAGHRDRARFSVAIRTATVDRLSGRLTYGTGGGITWGSRPESEFDEVLAKTAVLRARQPTRVGLIETMKADQDGIHNGDRHFARLRSSAEYFDFIFPAGELAVLFARCWERVTRVRLVLERDGSFEVTEAEVPRYHRTPELGLDSEPIDAASIWQRHKTTVRTHYDQARARAGPCDDVIMFNSDGNLTETTIANLMVKIGGTWYTPPVSDGCLPGTERGRLLDNGTIRERHIHRSELADCDGLALVSSLRGWTSATLTGGPGG